MRKDKICFVVVVAGSLWGQVQRKLLGEKKLENERRRKKLRGKSEVGGKGAFFWDFYNFNNFGEIFINLDWTFDKL